MDYSPSEPIVPPPSASRTGTINDTAALVRKAERRRTFHSLDLLRGIGALIVVMGHNRYLWWWVHCPEAFLAVDLFFILSGVVIANAYEARLLRGASVLQFSAIRVIRLYPIYLVGLVLGIVDVAMKGIGSDWHHLSHGTTWVVGIMSALLMLPAIAVPWFFIPRWTLFFELIANFLYARFIRVLTLPVLIGIMAASALGVAAAIIDYGTINVGYRFASLWGGGVRVGYSFFAGIVIYRLARHATRTSLSLVACFFCCTAGLLALTIHNTLARELFEFFMVTLLFPTIIWFAISIEPPAFLHRTASFLGMISYGLYVVHEPAGDLYTRMALALGAPVTHPSILLSLSFLCLITAAVWALDRFYDLPVRKWLNGLVGPLGPSRPPASATVLDTRSKA